MVKKKEKDFFWRTEQHVFAKNIIKISLYWLWMENLTHIKLFEILTLKDNAVNVIYLYNGRLLIWCKIIDKLIRSELLLWGHRQ